MVVAARMSGLVARDAVAQVDALDEAELVHAVERAVHACDPYPRAPRPDAIVDVVRREAAVLLAEELDDQAARPAAAAACVSQSAECSLRPGHSDNDTRSQRRATVVRVRAHLFLLVVFLAVGCAGPASESERTVVASFYPLAWAAERVAGDGVGEIVNLTPAGAEPHDIELSPSDVETIRDATLVVYIGGGFQPALEDAIDGRDGESLDLLRADEDPHIWLDPIRFAGAVERIGERLDGNAAGEIRALRELDTEYRTGLRDCERRVLVTTHAAFGQLAARYGLTQLSLAGRSPESEPGPRELEKLVDDVRASGATTVFAEPLVSAGLAETVAREADIEVATLDPIEGLSQERLDAGEDYLTVMRANLAALREALGCR